MAIQVTKPFTPSLNVIHRYLEQVHDSAWLTNNGPLATELTARLEDYLGVKNLVLTANGTLALQLAYKALGIESTAVTTPFTFIATASAMKWQRLQPWFADINAKTLGLSPQSTEQALLRDKQGSGSADGIVPVHVYGNPSDVEAFDRLGREYSLPVVYDASHAFGIQYKNESILNWGDASTLSFHATKLFHTVEGGAVVFKDRDLYEAAKRMINFGLGGGDDIASPGINAKMSEVHAAYGLANLDCLDQILERRLAILDQYQWRLNGAVSFPTWHEQTNQNGAYAPILLENESQCHAVLDSLKHIDVTARRYFYPSLHQVAEFANHGNDGCSNAQQAAPRVLCLPIYAALEDADIERICEAVKQGTQPRRALYWPAGRVPACTR